MVLPLETLGVRRLDVSGHFSDNLRDVEVDKPSGRAER